MDKMVVCSYSVVAMHYSVQLRIEGNGTDPAHVTREVRLSPTLTRRVGDRRSADSVWEKGLWALDAEGDAIKEWPSLEEGLFALMRAVESMREKLLSYKSSADVYFYCGQFSAGRGGGPRLSAELLKRLGEFGIPVHLHTYFADDPNS